MRGTKQIRLKDPTYEAFMKLQNERSFLLNDRQSADDTLNFLLDLREKVKGSVGKGGETAELNLV